MTRITRLSGKSDRIYRVRKAIGSGTVLADVGFEVTTL